LRIHEGFHRQHRMPKVPLPIPGQALTDQLQAR
jgi:hypothetical protein